MPCQVNVSLSTQLLQNNVNHADIMLSARLLFTTYKIVLCTVHFSIEKMY